MSEQLVSPLLASSLALVLLIPKAFGALLALLLVVALFSLRTEALRGLRKQDRVFLLLMNTYPFLVGTSMLLHGLDDAGHFDNASRFLLTSVVYVGLRIKPVDMRWVVAGAMLGCGLAFCASLWHLLPGPQLSAASQGRSVGFENAVVFAQIAFFLLLVATTPTDRSSLPGSRKRLLLITVMLMTSVSLIVSQSRAALMALLVLCGYLLFRDPRLRSSMLTRYAVLLAVGCAGIYLLNTPHLHHLGGTTSELLANYGRVDQFTSLGQRLALWSSSWQLVTEKPLFGYGVGQFNQALNGLPGAGVLTDTVRAYRHAHNDFLQIAVEQGLVGLAVFLLALAAILFMTYRERFAVDARHLLFGTMGCWLFFALTQTQLAHQKTAMMFAVLLALGFSQGMNRKYGPLDGG